MKKPKLSKVIGHLLGVFKYSFFKDGWRYSPQWALTKKLSKRRYGNKCYRCGYKRNIEIHHLNNAAHFPMERFEVANTRPLCRSCHRLAPDSIHKWMGGTHARTTRKDFRRWMKATK